MTAPHPYRRKLIEVALPLQAINEASARENSIRHGQPNTLRPCPWWARPPLAVCRAVLFASLVDDPDSDPAHRKADGTIDEDRAGLERAQRFNLIEELVEWENSNNPRVIYAARAEIARCVASRKIELGELKTDAIIFGDKKGLPDPRGPVSGDGVTAWEIVQKQARPEVVNAFLVEHAPPVRDPFGDGGSIPLEAQRLGRRAHAHDVNPVPILIATALPLIEIPPSFASGSSVDPDWNPGARASRPHGEDGATEATAGGTSTLPETNAGGTSTLPEATAGGTSALPGARTSRPHSEDGATEAAADGTSALPEIAAGGTPALPGARASRPHSEDGATEAAADGTSALPEIAAGGTPALPGARASRPHSEDGATEAAADGTSALPEATAGGTSALPGTRASRPHSGDGAIEAAADGTSALPETTAGGTSALPGTRASRPHGEDGATEATPGGTPALPARSHPGWHSRGYLPHFDSPGLIQSLTFRLHDALPRSVLEQWSGSSDVVRRRRAEAHLDKGQGVAYLKDPRIAEIVQNALLHFDGQRYRLLAWCVMPNHVHAVIETFSDHLLGDVVHSWKSYTANVANKLLGRKGAFWAADYFDRFVRDADHLEQVVAYVQSNPVKAGLAATPEAWPWTSAATAARASRPSDAARMATLPEVLVEQEGEFGSDRPRALS